MSWKQKSFKVSSDKEMIVRFSELISTIFRVISTFTQFSNAASTLELIEINSQIYPRTLLVVIYSIEKELDLYHLVHGISELESSLEYHPNYTKNSKKSVNQFRK